MSTVEKWTLAAARALGRASVAASRGQHERANMHLQRRKRILARIARMEAAS